MIRIDTRIALTALGLATGSLDVSAFLRLGGVFASIMTSNLIFISLAAVKVDASLAQHCVTALLCYVAGVAASSAFRPLSRSHDRPDTRRRSALFTAEAGVLIVFGIWWAAEGGHPGGWQQLSLLGAAAFAMGIQGVSTRELGDANAGTTYVTGSLTSIFATAVAGRRPDAGAALAIAGILAGAALGVGLLETAADFTPLVAVACVTFVAGISWHTDEDALDPRISAAVEMGKEARP
jgi:uncharacterized membrane protein YoaK (UPF0700 family)